MIHQYRQRIARTWRADTGRQPQVRVISYVMLNYKYPQPLPRWFTDNGRPRGRMAYTDRAEPSGISVIDRRPHLLYWVRTRNPASG